MFRNTVFQRAVASILLTTLSSTLVITPLTAAAQAGTYNDQRLMSRSSAPPSDVEQFAQLLADIRQELLYSPGQQYEAMAAKSQTVHANRVATIRLKANEARRFYNAIGKGFEQEEAHLKAIGAPEQMQARHQLTVRQFEDRKSEFERLITALGTDASPSAQPALALENLRKFMAQYPVGRPHQFTNPRNLPFGATKRTPRAPKTSTEEFHASLFPQRYDPVKLAGPVPADFQLTPSALPVAPNAQDLLATDEVQLTPEIQQQAELLGKNPVKIYNWVRNNIQFIPTYGSLQGSAQTLRNGKGNAFDTASLLIALYRASGIPARYVYGTIEVPVAKAVNWVGGVTKADAVQALLGQGSIPNVAVVRGGITDAIRMEHVWVQAYVDAVPSRGARTKSPGTWLPMDPSYKQYAYTEGMNLRANVKISPDVLESIKSGSVVDAHLGSVQGVNLAQVKSAVNAYESQLKAYVAGQKSDATLGDVLGTQSIIAEDYSILLGSLPYKTVATAAVFQAMPDNLRWKFRTNIYSADGISDAESPLIEIKQSTSSLAGRKITLGFVPATDADRDLMASYLPKPHADGSANTVADMPATLPGYMLRMKAELRIDGALAAQTGSAFTMGATVRQSMAFYNPGIGSWEGSDDNDVIVGEFDGIGIDLQGISNGELKNSAQRLGATNAKLNALRADPGNVALLQGMSREEVAGDIVHAGIIGYFALVDDRDDLLSAVMGNIRTYRAPSYGRFLINAQPRYFFGIVRNVGFGSAAMDVDFLRYHVSTLDDSSRNRIEFLRQAGAGGSAAEHEIPEAMFRNLDLPVADSAQPQAVSAVKALALAAAQGQKIYTLTATNADQHGTVLQSLRISAEAKAEIADALAMGHDVTVHEADISLNGWTGSGYVILDPDSGSGAYKVDGGSNGAYFQGLLFGMFTAILMFDIIIWAAVGGVAGALAMGAIAAAAAAYLHPITKMVQGMDADQRACFFSGFSTGFAIASFGVGLLLGGVGGLIFGAIGMAIGVAVGEYVNTTPGAVCRKG